MNLPRPLKKLINSLRKRVPFLRAWFPEKNERHRLHDRLGSPLPALPDLKALFRRHDVVPRGVLHVGAHEGAALESRLGMGFGRIVFVEANPRLIPGLRAKAIAYPDRVRVVHAAVTDRSGPVVLRVTSMDQGSSILPLGEHRRICPNVKEVGQVEVRGLTIDQLMAEEGPAPADYNFLNLDIQGAELMALRGASAFYERWIKEQGFDPGKHLPYVCSEDPAPYLGRFPGFVVRGARDVGVAEDMAAYFDYYVLTQADEVAIANSSYSLFASMINTRAKAFVRPCTDAGRLIPYDPWDARVVLDKKLTEAEHRRLREID